MTLNLIFAFLIDYVTSGVVDDATGSQDETGSGAEVDIRSQRHLLGLSHSQDINHEASIIERTSQEPALLLLTSLSIALIMTISMSIFCVFQTCKKQKTDHSTDGDSTVYYEAGRCNSIAEINTNSMDMLGSPSSNIDMSTCQSNNIDMSTCQSNTIDMSTCQSSSVDMSTCQSSNVDINPIYAEIRQNKDMSTTNCYTWDDVNAASHVEVDIDDLEEIYDRADRVKRKSCISLASPSPVVDYTVSDTRDVTDRTSDANDMRDVNYTSGDNKTHDVMAASGVNSTREVTDTTCDVPSRCDVNDTRDVTDATAAVKDTRDACNQSPTSSGDFSGIPLDL